MDVHLWPVPQDQPQGPLEGQPEGPNAAVNVPGDNEEDTLLSVHRDSNMRQFLFALDLRLFDSVHQLEILTRDTCTILYNLRAWRIPDDLIFMYSSQLLGGDSHTTVQARGLAWPVFRQLIRHMVTDDYIFPRTVPFYRVLLTGMHILRGSVNIRPFDIDRAEQYMLTLMHSPEDGPPPLQHAFSYIFSVPGILGVHEYHRANMVAIHVENDLRCVLCTDIDPNINNNIGLNINNNIGPNTGNVGFAFAGEVREGPQQGQQPEATAAANVPEGVILLSVFRNSNERQLLFKLDLRLFDSVQHLETLIRATCTTLYNLSGWRIPDDWTFVHSSQLIGGNTYTTEPAMELTWPAFRQIIRYVVLDDLFIVRLVPFNRVLINGEMITRGEVNVRPFDIDRAEEYMLARMYVQSIGDPPLPGPPLQHVFSYLFLLNGNLDEVPRDHLVNNMPLEHVEQGLQGVLCRDIVPHIHNNNVDNIGWPEAVAFADAGDEAESVGSSSPLIFLPPN